MYSLHLMSNNSIKGHFGLRNTIAAVKLVNLKARKVSATFLKWSISNTAHVEFFSITFSVVETLHMFKGGTEPLKFIHWLRSFPIVLLILVVLQYSVHFRGTMLLEIIH